ncbi:MAG: glycosyltransferase, partial [Actinomycetes bacterium]
LYVGALEPRKGIDTLAKAIEIARRIGLTLPLIVVGEGRSAPLLDGAAGVKLVGRQSDQQLSELYAGASALVVPSVLEGFGLPPVEAAAHGVVSVTSDLPVFRETLGDAILTFPVGDAESLAKTLVLISGDEGLRTKLGAAAKQAIRPLTWGASAHSLHRVLSEVVSKRR